MQKLLDWEAANRIGDIASVLGLVLGLIGFAFTLFAVYSSRSASLRAEQAVQKAVMQIRLLDDVVDITMAISTLEELQRIQRAKQWILLPDRYASLRKTLVTIRAIPDRLNVDQQQKVQDAIATLQSIESAIEKGLKDPTSLNAVRFNTLLARQIDALQTTLTQLKAS